MVKKVRNMLWFTSACEGRLRFVPQGLQCQSYLPAQLLLSNFLTCLSPDETSYQKFPVSMVSACQINFLCPRCMCASQPAGSPCQRESDTLLENKSARCQGILITTGAAWQASGPLVFIWEVLLRGDRRSMNVSTLVIFENQPIFAGVLRQTEEGCTICSKMWP